jgi:hypothetical protein
LRTKKKKKKKICFFFFFFFFFFSRWGWRNLVESQTVTDGWALEESAM